VTFLSVVRDIGTLGGIGVIALFIGHQALGFMRGFRTSAAGQQWHLVRCTRCNKELEYAGEFGCDRPKDSPEDEKNYG
jgi:hypothetical protein